MHNPNRRVYLIEDDAGVSSSLRRFLSDEGFRVLAFFDGRSGLAGIEAVPPACVLVDGKLPDLSGPEVAKRIQERHPRVAIIAMPGIYRSADWSSIRLAAVCEKPCHLPTLLAAVRTAVEHR